MKISMPVDQNSMQAPVCISFGRAPYFLIFDTETQESILIENTAATSHGGAGIKAAQILADNKINVLLTPRCGENAEELLTSASISIYKTIGTSTSENIDAFKNNKLNLLTEIHPGFHHHGGR